MRYSRGKIRSRSELARILTELRDSGSTVVFTNGCFDLMHPGHVRYLEKARTFGDVLVVALNSDESVRANKGEGRPVMSQQERCEMVGALGCVDWVTVFEERTPRELIGELSPDVLVKGGDWPSGQIVGRRLVEASGGRVISIEFEEGYSTTDIIERVLRSNGS